MQASDTKVSFGKFDFDERLQKVLSTLFFIKLFYKIQGYCRNGLGKTNTRSSRDDPIDA